MKIKVYRMETRKRGRNGGREGKRQEGMFQVDTIQEMLVVISHHLSF